MSDRATFLRLTALMCLLLVAGYLVIWLGRTFEPVLMVGLAAVVPVVVGIAVVDAARGALRRRSRGGLESSAPASDGDEFEAGSGDLSDARFEELVRAALDDLPPAFAERLGNVAVRVAEAPGPEEAARLEPGRVLLGLYQGVPATQLGADGAPASTITIYRRSMEYVYRDPAALEEAVRTVVFHEVGHYFGFSDAELDGLQGDRWAAVNAAERGRR